MRLTVGFNWQESLLRTLGRLNNQYSSGAIDEVYASLPEDPIGSAREKSRVKHATPIEVERALRVAEEVGIEVNYLLNSPTVPPLSGTRRDEARTFLETLVSAGVKSFTVTAPHLIQTLREWFGDLPIDVSSVANITSVDELRYYADFAVRRIKLSVDRNRDFALLEAFVASSRKSEIELIVNECCLLHCPLRAHHLTIQGMTYFGSSVPSGYPYRWCFQKLFPEGRPSVELLKSPWIRPTDLEKYERIGIRRFKISGRTMPEAWIADTAEAYMARTDDIDLVQLFPIVADGPKSEGHPPALGSLDASKLDGFIEFFEKERPDCRRECGSACRHCHSFYTSSGMGEAQESAR